MDQNQIVDDDLQKAINDITKSTETDPVFADTVAAPEPVAPVQATAVEEIATIMPEPIAPAPSPAPESMPAPKPPMPEFSAPVPDSVTPDFGTPAEVVESTSIEAIAPVELATPDSPNTSPAPTKESETPPAPMDINDIKTAALNDLTPLLSEVAPHLKDANIKPATKFNLYKKIITELGDKDAIGTAYETANQISDDNERSSALLSLIEVIDQM
ncbi:hypothetical protein IJG04_02945 [Candidatus Saccharibacteria bacterium]|nr:hypothetical protein [Candidatus Saccharibacteria bacterium]